MPATIGNILWKKQTNNQTQGWLWGALMVKGSSTKASPSYVCFVGHSVCSRTKNGNGNERVTCVWGPRNQLGLGMASHNSQEFGELLRLAGAGGGRVHVTCSQLPCVISCKTLFVWPFLAIVLFEVCLWFSDVARTPPWRQKSVNRIRFRFGVLVRFMHFGN